MPKARPQTINKASLADIVDEPPGLKAETPCRRTQEPFISSATAPIADLPKPARYRARAERVPTGRMGAQPILMAAYGWSAGARHHQRRMVEARAHNSTATAAAAIPGVVLCVADGIVRIAAGIIRAAARLSGGIDRLIGVTAGEEKRCDHDRDEPTSGAFVWSMRRGVGHHALRSQRWRSH